MGLALLFPGQGSQSAGMGAELFEEFPELTAVADAVLGYSVRELCADGDKRLHRTEYAQPALFVVSALHYLRRQRSCARASQFLAGHSLGELTALFAAGCFDFETGVRIVRRRGELMAATPDGGMMAVLGLEPDRLQDILSRGGLHTVDVANHNVPGQLVLAGPKGSAHTVAVLLANEGAGKCVPLNVSIAAHSRYMADAARGFEEYLRGVEFAEPRIPVIANVTARPHTAERMAELLVRHLCEPVRWWDTLRLLAANGVDTVEEVGPGEVLSKMWRRGLPDLPIQPDLPAAGAEAGAAARTTVSDRAQVIVLSAADKESLDRYAARMAEYFQDPDSAPIADVAFSLRSGRAAQPHRLAVLADDAQGASAGLRRYLAGRSDAAVRYAVVAAGSASDSVDPKTPAAAADAWLSGAQVRWDSLGGTGRRVPLPSVPWPGAATVEIVAAGSNSSALDWLIGAYAQESGMPADRIDPRVPLTDYGLSSLIIARLNARLADELGEDDQTLFFAHPDLASVAGELAARHSDHWIRATTTVAPLSTQPEPQSQPQPQPQPQPQDPDTAIAVIGIAGRYPQSPDLDAFWETLSTGRDCVTRIPDHRAREGWPVDKMWGGFLDAVEEFDPLLFQITPRDAELMDPQERLFLEVVWEALEDAGYSRDRLARRHGSQVAVFAGAMHNEYPYFGVEQSLAAARQDSGATLGGIANRVSFFFDLHGPSMSIDTMCSSGLTALHLAVRSLRSGECQAAIVGAVNLSLHPNKFVQQHRMKLNSSTNRCRSFGAGGDGFVPAEGAGALLLKPLRQALADGDRVHAVIRGTSVVHAGRTNGYLVPNPQAQADMVAAALRDAGVDAADLGYLELHGAGTALGDPVEIDGLMRVFGDAGLPAGSVPIGSVKSVIGHVEAGAGIAGLTKVILQLRHGTLAPSLHADELNPGIKWDRIPFRVQRQAAAWPAAPGRGPRRAGISSFGAGGTISHVIVQEAPPQAQDGDHAGTPGAPRLVVLSAVDADQLARVAQRLARRLRPGAGQGEPSAPALADVAYTLQVGREALRERWAVVVRGIDELCDAVQALAEGRPVPQAVRGRVPSPGYAAGDPLDAGELSSLADQWVAGNAVDWESIARRDGARPRIVSLPSYPFARTRCWLPAADPAATVAEIPLYERTWERAEPGAGWSGTWAGSVVCVFSEAGEQVARLVAERFGGGRVLLVREGADFGDGVPGFTGEADAVALADGLLAAHPDLAGWLDLADLYRAPGERGLWRARLAMMQRVVRARAVAGLRILQTTYGLQTFSHPHPGAAGARMAAFVRVLGAEYRRLAATVLDIDVPAGDPERAARAVWAEWEPPDRVAEVCHRGGQRFRPALASIAAPYRAWRADPDAAYVVAGGTRGLGLLVAGFLAERGARRLALIGTRAPAPDDPGIRALTQRGARVSVHAGSLADAAGLAAFLDRTRADGGRIAGIVNCAGRSGQRTGFAYMDLDELPQTLDPKADGAEELADLTAADHPDFAIHFSSMCAAAPAIAAGVTDYAAANACLDFTTQHRLHAGQSWHRTINWPQWNETGGGRGTANPCALLGVASLSDAEGLRILERVLALPRGTVLVPAPALDGAVDVRALVAMPGEAAPARGLDVGAPAANGTAVAATPVFASVAAAPIPASADESPALVPPAWLVDIFASALRIPPADLDPTAQFGDLGVESIMLGELLLAIEGHLGRPLEPSLLFDHPTLESLTAGLGVAEQTAPALAPALAPAPAPALAPALAPAPAPAIPAAVPPPASDNRIAVIGMSCRFPDAPDLDTFWANLLAARSSITEVPASRWDVARWFRAPLEVGYSMSKWGGFVSGIEDFDPDYFHLGEQEATGLDPAIRMVLEGSATCLREAGYTDGELAGGQVGVFVGARLSEYGRRVGTGSGVLRSDQNFIAAHVAHHFDFHGPNLVVDSACSSSLVAVQMACRSLLAGETTAALAAGVEVLLDEQSYIDLSAARALSPTGRCRTFDQGADGFVPGEGCGVLLLKPLAAALADGDRVHAVLEAVAVNNDGRTMGITTPNPAAQAAVVRSALAAAGRDPREVGLVEAHGTGTLIGDPIELRGLADVFMEQGPGPAASTPPRPWCAIGSVKTNIGHTLSAAGLAGLAKTVLAVEHGVIPATLSCQTPNPRFDFEHSPFFPATLTQPWSAPPAARVAGVSSFGLGGTNAHLVLSGFDPAWRTGHPAARPALPPPVFNRRRLWLDAVPRPEHDEPTPPPPPPPSPALTPQSPKLAQPPVLPPPAPAPAPDPLPASLLDLALEIDGVAVAAPHRP